MPDYDSSDYAAAYDDTTYDPANDTMRDYGSTASDFNPSNLFGAIGRLFSGTSDAGKWGQMGAFMGLAGLANQSKFFNAPVTRVGYQGGIPQFTATREQTPYMQQRGEGYRPGQGGETYFTPMQYQYSGGDIGIPATNIPGGTTTATGSGTTGGTAAIPGGGITEGALRRILGADYDRIMKGQTASAPAPAPTPAPAPAAMYTGGTPGFDESTGRQNFAGFGFDQGLVDYLNQQRQWSVMDGGIDWTYNPQTKLFSGYSMAGPVTATLAQLQREAANAKAGVKTAATTGGISTLPGITPVTTGGTAFPYTHQEVADMARQATVKSTTDTRAPAPPPPAVDTSAQDAEQARYNAELEANLYKKPQYGANFNFDRRYPNNWGVVTGTLEDRIFRKFGDAVGRYTSSQIKPDEVKALADRVRAGTLKEADVTAAIRAAEPKKAARGGIMSDFYPDFDGEPNPFRRQPITVTGDQQFDPLGGIRQLTGGGYGMPRGEGVPGIVNRGVGAGVGPYTPPDTPPSPYPGTQYVAEPPAAYIPPPPPSPAPAPIPPPPAVYTQPDVVHPMTTPGVSQDVQDLINMYTQTGTMGEPDMNQVMTPSVAPGGSPGLVNPVSFNPSDFGGLIGDTQEADAKAKLGDVTGFTKEQAQQKAQQAVTPGATYEQVMQAYQSNPFAVKAPDESAINYWMSQGLGSFNDVVNQARATDPALAASIDAQRTNVQRPGEGAYSIAALGDSTTYGYNQGQQLPNNMVTSAEDYLHSINPNISIQNYGQTATTLGDALNSDVFDKALNSNAGTVLLNYGLNESYRNVDPKQFAADLDAAIKRAKAAGKNVVLQTPNPVGSSAASDWASDLDQYVQAIREAAARNNVALHDKYSYGQSLGDVTSQGDPTHPTGKAYTQFGTNLGKFLEGYLYGKPPGGAAGGLGSIIEAKGGRFLRGPGDGVSDSIEARFTKSGQPARLADGEFVIDARTVSELGNGSSEAGARKLYAMMDRVHKMRKKAKRGEPSGADKNLPA